MIIFQLYFNGKKLLSKETQKGKNSDLKQSQMEHDGEERD